nr:MAG TPA: hypothetical protein [Caudoviricetes sp.]
MTSMSRSGYLSVTRTSSEMVLTVPSMKMISLLG